MVRIKRICKTCGNTFYVKPSKVENGRGKFCSLECRNISYSRNNTGKNSPFWKPRIKRICQTCGKEFEVVPSRITGKNKGLFCSRKCWHIALSQKGPKRENSNFWKGGKIKCVCMTCGNVFFVFPSKIKTGRGKYCCQSCRSKTNRKHQKFPKHHTKPERVFKDICKKYSLPFKYSGDGSLWLGNANPDFIHNTRKLVCEVFGDFWHSPLLRWNLRYNETLEGRREQLKAEGYKTIFIWESDLKRKDAEQFVLYTLAKHNIHPSTTQ